MRKSVYLQAVAWFLLSLLTGCGNDALAKYLIQDGVPFNVIAFSRLSISALLMAAWALIQGKAEWRTSYIKIHILRGILLCIGMGIWTRALQHVPLPLVTLIGLTLPFFVMAMAFVFLGDQVPWFIWCASCLGMGGVVVVLWPEVKDTTLVGGYSFLLLLGVCIFALLDVLHQRYLPLEKRFPLLFYATFVAACGCLPWACQEWVPLTYRQIGGLIGLGIGGALLIVALLKAYSLAPISSLAPLRYGEFFCSLLFNSIVFHETLPSYFYIGAMLILSAMCFVVIMKKK